MKPLFVLLCWPLWALAAPPEWYASQQLDYPHFAIGYGAGDSLAAAKSAARAELARSRSTRVTSQMQFTTRAGPDGVQQEGSTTIAEQSSAELSDLETLRSEVVDGQYYVAIGHNQRSLADRVRALPTVRETRDQIPKHSPLATALGGLTAALTYTGGEYLIVRADNSVTVRAAEIEQLLPATQSNRLSLAFDPPGEVYRPETLFFVKFKANEAGWLNYLQLFADGATLSLIKNRQVKAGAAIEYPDRRDYDGLVTELPRGKAQTRVVHLVALCPNKRDFDRFDPIASQRDQHYESYRLGELNERLAGCELSTRVQVIR
jgi:hypothetical protein